MYFSETQAWKDIKGNEAPYKILLSERTNGKSYALKEYLLKKAWADNSLFIYLKRWSRDIKPSVAVQYFEDIDIAKLTKGGADSITIYAGEIFFSIFDIEKEKNVMVKKCGNVLALADATHYKSLSFSENTQDIIFEEFCTDSGYLLDEPKKLSDIVSTVFRKRIGTVWMIGNKIDRLNPFFSEWELVNTPKMKPNTCDIYTHHGLSGAEVKIAVLMCPLRDDVSKTMFFGRTAKMIDGGKWESNEYLTLPKQYEEYACLYTAVIDMRLTCYVLRVLKKEDEMLLFVSPASNKNPYKYDTFRRYCEKPTERFLQNCYSYPWTVGFSLKTKGDKIVLHLIKESKVCFSDNLTGTEFYESLKRMGVKI